MREILCFYLFPPIDFARYCKIFRVISTLSSQYKNTSFDLESLVFPHALFGCKRPPPQKKCGGSRNGKGKGVVFPLIFFPPTTSIPKVEFKGNFPLNSLRFPFSPGLSAAQDNEPYH